MSSCRRFIRRNKPFIDLANLIALIITAVFIIFYWAETQEMKNEMITQNKINSQAIKSSLLPVIDVQFEKVKSLPEMAQFPIQFAYDIYLENKGNGPAFNVRIQRLVVPNKNRQKTALKQTSRGKLEQFTKKIPMIGRGERVKIHREHSDSYEYVQIKISYRDHFRDLHKSAFGGDRDGLELEEYPVLEALSNMANNVPNGS